MFLEVLKFEALPLLFVKRDDYFAAKVSGLYLAESFLHVRELVNAVDRHGDLLLCG